MNLLFSETPDIITVKHMPSPSLSHCQVYNSDISERCGNGDYLLSVCLPRHWPLSWQRLCPITGEIWYQTIKIKISTTWHDKNAKDWIIVRLVLNMHDIMHVKMRFEHMFICMYHVFNRFLNYDHLGGRGGGGGGGAKLIHVGKRLPCWLHTRLVSERTMPTKQETI